MAPMPKECPTHGQIAALLPGKNRETTHVAMILDESGSMASCRATTISGFNEYISGLKKDKNSKYVVTLTKFDAHMDSPTCREVFTNKPIANIRRITEDDYAPRGGTPMYDAIGESVEKIDGKSASKFVVVIMTDGEENASKKHTKDSIKKLIAEKEALGNWTFIYLGANQNAWQEATAMGIATGNAINYQTARMASTMSYLGNATRSYAGSSLRATSCFFGGDSDVPEDDTVTSTIGSLSQFQNPNKLGGQKRMAKLDKTQRSELAKNAALARWGNKS